jgi:peptide chain release factor 2
LIIKFKMEKEEIKKHIQKIEEEMNSVDFWSNKDLAQQKIKELQELKDSLLGLGKYDKGDAIINIFAGAGGDDAEDWTRMLYEMYLGFASKNNFSTIKLFENKNDNGGYRTITFQISGKNVYGLLKNESGTHRLVRISPFNANDKRQTSFAMVEVLPEFKDDQEIKISPEDIEFETTKSSGPGGQNVNKRETAVRIKHKETGITVFVSTERSQQQNRDKAMEILRGKLYNLREAEQEKQQSNFSVSKNVSAEWGSQIRSYVLHPYKLVKDHRSNFETNQAEKVLGGDIIDIIQSLKN